MQRFMLTIECMLNQHTTCQQWLYFVGNRLKKLALCQVIVVVYVGHDMHSSITMMFFSML